MNDIAWVEPVLLKPHDKAICHRCGRQMEWGDVVGAIRPRHLVTSLGTTTLWKDLGIPILCEPCLFELSDMIDRYINNKPPRAVDANA